MNGAFHGIEETRVINTFIVAGVGIVTHRIKILPEGFIVSAPSGQITEVTKPCTLPTHLIIKQLSIAAHSP